MQTAITAGETLASNFNRDDRLFDAFAMSCEHQFGTVAAKGEPLFTTDVDDLYAVYLDSFPPSERQYHTCNCCRQFIRRYGNLVTIDEVGRTTSAVWNPDTAPEQFKPIAAALRTAVSRAKVNGVFISNEKVWGTPVTGEWHHFAIRPDSARLHRDRLATPHQAMALKKQDFGTLSHGLADFNADVVKQAVNLLETDALYRSEKVIGPARFLLDLHAKIYGSKLGRDGKNNLVWKAVATAPVGFATPRSSMIGTLLSDIAEGMSFDAVKRRFAEKMHPLQYQRPQAHVSAGNIAQAEKIVAQLGIANSLKRRFARIDEVKLFWSPKFEEKRASQGGVFDHLLGQQNKERAGAKDTRNAGMALFPEILKKELHPIRSTIESYSKHGQLEGAEEASANGILVGDHGLGTFIRVSTALGTAEYTIDRWD